jgi:hypothetical protein
MEQREAAMANTAGRASALPGVVVVHAPAAQGFTHTHERVTRSRLARRLAALKGFGFAGEHDPARPCSGPVYFVPSDTLVGAETADALGIRSEHDLFGGVVPHAFVATKAITHPLAAPDAEAPAGWSHEFARRVRDVVLAGYTAFSREDARRAGMRLLERGPVRLKPVRATGGRGQAVVARVAELEAALEAMDVGELPSNGLVLEEDLAAVTTYSIGQVRVADMVATYHGTQRLTRDNRGASVYGGSDLVVVRGGFEALLGLALPDAARRAAMQACAYDEAAMACFPGSFLSRRNYDIAQGVDAAGRWRSGVLEQSWRIGGASGAEIAALEAFRADPALRAVRAATVEVYGEGVEPPPQAIILFHGVDERVGPITKYALVEPHVDAR